MEEKRVITPLDVAKFLGVEKDYLDVLFEAELKKNEDIIMSENVNENNSSDNEKQNGK
jgi:hypothetical protein